RRHQRRRRPAAAGHAPALPEGLPVRRGRRQGRRGGADGPLVARPYEPAAVRGVAAARRRARGRPCHARPGALHPQLRRPGHRRRVGAVAHGRAARPAARPGAAGVLPARRGHRALPARPGRAGTRRGPQGRRRGDPAAVRRHAGALPDGGGRGQLLRGREVAPALRAVTASQSPASVTITPTPTPSTPYERPPTITPATTVPVAPHTFISRSDRPCTAG